MDRERQPAMRPSSRGTRRTDGRARDVDPRDARPTERSVGRSTGRSSRPSRDEPRRRSARDDRDERDERDDEWPPERSGGVRALLHGFAVVRWVLLIFAVGLGIAAVVAIALAALFALVNASV